MSSLLSIAASGLSAAYAGLQTTGHNIANVNTPGYSRQLTIQTPATAQYSGAGFIGRGVDVTTVQRVYSDFLTNQAHQATALSAELGTRATQMNSIQTVLGPSDGGVAAALNNFYAALNSAAANPSDLASRQAALSSAQQLAAQFNAAAGELDQQRTGAEQQIRLTLSEVNQAASQIASLNDKISLGLATGQSPNDLMDQRDALIRKLSNDIGVSVVKQSDGAYNVFVGTGQPLVVGDRASILVAAADPYDPQRMVIGFQNGTSMTQLRSSDFSGGSLSGLLKFVEQDLPLAQDGLGRIATAMADAFNTQHQLGIDLNGNTGTKLFNIAGPPVFANRGNAGPGTLAASITNTSVLAPSAYRVAATASGYTVTRLSDNTSQLFATLPQTIDGVTLSMSGTPATGDSFMVEPVRLAASSLSVAVASPQALALAAPVIAATPQTNRGQVSVDALSVNGPALNANIAQTVTITFTGPNTFNVTGIGTGNPSGLSYTPGATITYNGWTLTLSGTATTGDSVSIGPNSGLSGDNRNGVALAAVGSASVLGGSTLGDAMGAVISQIGSTTAGLQSASAAQEQILTQARQDEQSLSGVNLDEEATRLMQYQQAYQAAAKVVATAQTIFDTLLALGK